MTCTSGSLCLCKTPLHRSYKRPARRDSPRVYRDPAGTRPEVSFRSCYAANFLIGAKAGLELCTSPANCHGAGLNPSIGSEAAGGDVEQVYVARS